MRVSMCVGNYAKTPYCIAVLDMRVHCLEELCYCLCENAFLLDLSLLDEKLVDWIGEDCGVGELAAELYPMVRKQGSLSAFVILILEYVGLYDAGTIRKIEQVLKDGSGLSILEKRKNQVDYLVRKAKYPAAIRRYNELLETWKEESAPNGDSPMEKVKAAILHNKGVALAGMLEYEAAANCFMAAWESDARAEYYYSYLAAKRAQLSEGEYLALVASVAGSYEPSLQLEKEMERLLESFKKTEAGRKIALLKKWRYDNRQNYYDELDKIARMMKAGYRNSVSD